MRHTLRFKRELLWQLMLGLSLVLGWSARAEAPLEPEPLEQGTLAERQHRAARRLLATNSYRSVAVSPSGDVWVWGNGLGRDLGTWPEIQLGTGLPVRMPRMTEAVSASSASGGGHSLILLEDGTVMAWGINNVGQLGDGTTLTGFERVKVKGLTEVVAIVAGDTHSLAARRDGSVWAWGSNSYGQLGDGTTTRRLLATPIPGLSQIVAVAAGSSHSLALRADGTVWAWGTNSYGQLGDGTRTQRLSPVQVPGLTDVVAIDTRFATSYAVRTDGSVWAWGANFSGQLGDGTQSTYRATPAPVPGLTQVVSVAAGHSHALALRRDGSLWAWGTNHSGQLGRGTESPTGLPEPVPGLEGVIAAAADSVHSLALRRDGSVYTWGHNQLGAMGTGSDRQATPTRVDLRDVRAMASNSAHAVAIRQDGSVWRWGQEITDGTLITRATPERVQGLSHAVAIAAGAFHSVVALQDGTVWAWGDNFRGQLGQGTFDAGQDTPVQVQGLSDVVAVAAGDFHSLALKRDGTVWAWGANYFGQLGNVALELYDSPVPVQVQGLQGVSSIAAGLDFSAAITSDGTVWQWGSTMLAWYSGDMMPRPPEPAPGLSNAVKVVVMYTGLIALRADGTARQWNVSPFFAVYPDEAFEAITGAVDLVASASSIQILRADGTVWNFGSNLYSERGFPTEEATSYELAQVPGLSGGVALAADSFTVYALRENGRLMAWGSNSLGNIGNGELSVHLRPVRVKLPCKLKDLSAAEGFREHHCHAEP
ncbi:RCC1-like domain-containing protein [Hyalangium minutum]|uniref:BNR repeat domain protein n=1 Tax=Hyalangium minutum TaxID=394096 RepID=A0A085WMV9_9BACT|nr:RCC1 domain-containing protein [Hyalangium minutum]KFE69022.1 BNR repeat domain protein [Hyalangium minutum]